MKLTIKFAWYDLWIGFYIDRKNKVLYFCPLPTILFRFELKEKNDSLDEYASDLAGKILDALKDGTPEDKA